jgi:hypothetical protein
VVPLASTTSDDDPRPPLSSLLHIIRSVAAVAAILLELIFPAADASDARGGGTGIFLAWVMLCD